MIHLYVCRHGESQLNAQGIYSGQTDTPLTDHGRTQAKQAGQGALQLDLDLIVSSTLVRALETAQIIAAATGYPADEIAADPLFMERSYGSLEGKPFSTLADPQIFTDIETEDALAARAQTALAYLRGLDEENVLLVSHGTFLLKLNLLINPNASSKELPNAIVVQLI